MNLRDCHRADPLVYYVGEWGPAATQAVPTLYDDDYQKPYGVDAAVA